MTNEEIGILSALRSEWAVWKAGLKRLGSVDIRSEDATRVFRIDDARSNDEVVAIEFGTIALNMAERGGGGQRSLFICIQGYFWFLREVWREREVLASARVGAEVAYFRLRQQSHLGLVYAAHYDHAPNDELHPVFHSQLRGGMHDYGSFIQQQFRGLKGDVRDEIAGMLRTVRIASAQLDVFSVLLQVSADHLVGKESSRDQRAEFNRLRRRDALCAHYCKEGGDGPQGLPSSMPSSAYRCYRARHWYAEIR